MIGGARTFKYYVDLDKFKLNLAGQELKEKRFEDYQKICRELDKGNLCIVNGEKKSPSLSNAILNFYDVFSKNKSLTKIRALNSDEFKKNKSPSKLVDMLDDLYEDISSPTLAFLKPNSQELNKELLNYNGVREELKNPIMNYVQKNPMSCGLKIGAAGFGLIVGTISRIGIAADNHLIGIPLTIASGFLVYDSAKQMIAYNKHDKKENFIHEKEFRNLLYSAQQTDKYMTKNIDLTPPRKPMMLGGRGELEEEAIEIREKLKRQK